MCASQSASETKITPTSLNGLKTCLLSWCHSESLQPPSLSTITTWNYTVSRESRDKCVLTVPIDIVYCHLPYILLLKLKSRSFPIVLSTQNCINCHVRNTPRRSGTDYVIVNNAMSSTPVDILRLILEHVDRTSLIRTCLLNKTCSSCAQDVLYRHI